MYWREENPSRFIHQLKTQGIDKVQVVHQLAMPVLDAVTPTLMEIKKDPSVIEKLLEKATSGFSPSALNTYIRNPIDFYKRYILKLKDPEVLEELIAYNTFGTIVHDSLEALYTPCIGQILTENHFKEIKTQLPNILAHFFEKHHSPTQSLKGKNLIAFSVLLEYLKDFLEYDQICAQKEEIYIESLEKEYQMTLQIPGVSQSVLFKGSLDRVDKRNGVTHIIDFKTGAVKPTELKLKDWEDLKDSPEKDKIFQLLSYAALYGNSHGNEPVKTGIYSFKNTQEGYMFFEDSLKPSDKSTVEEGAFSEFKEVLIGVVQELFNIEKPFVEKEV
jgi:ATP-dependent helicase/DNAse subunit B